MKKFSFFIHSYILAYTWSGRSVAVPECPYGQNRPRIRILRSILPPSTLLPLRNTQYSDLGGYSPFFTSKQIFCTPHSSPPTHRGKLFSRPKLSTIGPLYTPLFTFSLVHPRTSISTFKNISTFNLGQREYKKFVGLSSTVRPNSEWEAALSISRSLV